MSFSANLLIPMHPVTLAEHRVEDCLFPLNCGYCMNYCYEGHPGHMFPRGQEKPCNCGFYADVEAYLAMESAAEQ